MTVTLRTLTGEIPYDVEQQIKELVLAVNVLEDRAGPDLGPLQQQIETLAADLDAVERQAQVNAQRIEALAVRVTALEP